MMPPPETIHSSTVLFVFNGQDEPLCRCCQTLTDGGVQVYYVPDVYSAMAQLAQGTPPGHLVVDIRLLDNYEMRFLALVPHYYPNTELLVPQLEGTTERAVNQAGHIESIALQDLTDGILGIRQAVTASSSDDEVVEWVGEDAGEAPIPADLLLDAAPMETTSTVAQGHREPQAIDDEQGTLEAPQHTDALSTDGGAESTEAGLSLHEVVRQRMAGRQPSRIPRRPPQAAPPEDSVLPPSSAVSPEEMEALLEEADEPTPAPPIGGREGGETQ